MVLCIIPARVCVCVCVCVCVRACVCVQVASSGFVTEEKAVEVEEFFKKNPTPSAERIVRQNCEAIRLNAKWLERDSKAIQEWLKTH